MIKIIGMVIENMATVVINMSMEGGPTQQKILSNI